MSETPEGIHYAESHEWARLDENGRVIVGITDFAQDALGDIVYVELPQMGELLQASVEAGVVESVKAASDLYMPVDAEVIEGNSGLEDAPEQVNQSPFHEGWIIKIKILDASQIEELLDASAYAELAKN